MSVIRNGGTYTYAYEPAKDGDPLTLVMLHGTGGDHTSFVGLGRLVSPSAGLIALKGDVDENGNLRFFRRVGERKYDMADLAERTRALTDALPGIFKEHGRNPDRAVGLGYSNGANMLANVMFEAPERLAGAVLMHPFLPYDPPSPPGLAGKPVLITYGRHDPVVSSEHIAEVIAAFRARGAKVEPREVNAGHEVRQDEIDTIGDWLKRIDNQAAV